MQVIVKYANSVRCPRLKCFISKKECINKCLYGVEDREFCLLCEIGRQLINKKLKEYKAGIRKDEQDARLGNSLVFIPQVYLYRKPSKKRIKFVLSNNFYNTDQLKKKESSEDYVEYEEFLDNLYEEEYTIDYDKYTKIINKGYYLAPDFDSIE